MKKLILFLIAVFIFTCSTPQKRDSKKQITENETALALSEDAKKVLDNSDLPKEEKSKIYAALGSGKSAIINSTETIKNKDKDIEAEKEIKNKLIFENTQLKAVNKFLIYSVILNIVFIVIFVLLIVNWLKSWRFRRLEKAVTDAAAIVTNEIKEGEK